jgi:hypothetical protein
MAFLSIFFCFLYVIYKEDLVINRKQDCRTGYIYAWTVHVWKGILRNMKGQRRGKAPCGIFFAHKYIILSGFTLRE